MKLFGVFSNDFKQACGYLVLNKIASLTIEDISWTD